MNETAQEMALRLYNTLAGCRGFEAVRRAIELGHIRTLGEFNVALAMLPGSGFVDVAMMQIDIYCGGIGRDDCGDREVHVFDGLPRHESEVSR